MADLHMNDAERSRIAASIRTAAIVAAKGRPIGEDSINRIIDEASNPNLSEADRVAIATSRAEQEVGIGKPLNELSATPRELDSKLLTGGLLAGRLLDGMRGLRELAGSDDGRGAASGARYDGINGGGLNPTQIQTRNYAIQQGVMWAADNPEILKLGNSAIDIIKQTQLRKDVFDGLTKDAGLSAKGAVGIAKIAKDRGEDANQVGQEVTNSLRQMNDRGVTGAVDERARLELDPKATQEQKDAASQKVDEALDTAVARDPSKAEAAEKLKKRLGTAAKKNEAQAAVTAGKDVAADVKDAKADAKDAKADALLAELGDTKPAASAPTGQQNAPGRPDPSRPEAARSPGNPRAAPKP
ncbi:MAG: hypothetical protein A4S14_14640 [Proteobacteria bacterium SG_bin9]|nr:MAG: hypothetical protein A4S14_14640 [Proteobacteria bacterium SG_bin9]